jgi:hypothetical protein
MSVKSYFKTHLIDTLVVGITAVLASAGAIFVASYKPASSHIADISVKGTLYQTIDLSKESNVRTIELKHDDGTHMMDLEVKLNAIRVADSDCHNQYCVFQGWISEAGHPIICAVNQVIITIEGISSTDVNIG